MAALVYPYIVEEPAKLGEIFSAILAAVNSIDAENLAPGAVTEPAFSVQCVPTSAYQLLSVTAGVLAPDSVGTVKLQDEAVTDAKILDGTITAGKMAEAANYAEWKIVMWVGNGAATRKIENIITGCNFVAVFAQYTSSVRVMTGYDVGGMSKTMSSSVYNADKFEGWTATGFEVKLPYNANAKTYVALVGKMNTQDIA